MFIRGRTVRGLCVLLSLHGHNLCMLPWQQLFLQLVKSHELTELKWSFTPWMAK
jgi:hypothetical protein